MNPLTELRARLRETELNIAARIDDNTDLRMCARLWSHAGPRPLWVLFGGFPLLGFTRGQTAPVILLAALASAVYIGAHLADAAHETGWTDRVHPCPLCHIPPGAEDDDGNGGGGWPRGGPDTDIPPAPTPMPDYDDEQWRAIAGDLDAQLADLIASTRRARTGEAP